MEGYNATLNQNLGEITVKLSPKGFYIWAITVPLGDATGDSYSIERLKQLDASLRDAFPTHASKGSSRSSSFDTFDE